MNWYKKSQLVRFPLDLDAQISTLMPILKQKFQETNRKLPTEEIFVYKMPVMNTYNSNRWEYIEFFLNNQYMNSSNGLMFLERERKRIGINYSPDLANPENFDDFRQEIISIIRHEITHYFDRQNERRFNKPDKQSYDASDVEFAAIFRQIYDEFENYYKALNPEEKSRFINWIEFSTDFNKLEYEYNNKKFEIGNRVILDKINTYVKNNALKKLKKIRTSLKKYLLREVK